MTSKQPNTQWNELVKIVLVGLLSNASYPQLLRKQLAQYGIGVSSQKTGETTVLKAITILHRLHLSAQQPKEWKQNKTINQAPTEQQSQAAPSHIEQLNFALSHRYPLLVIEILKHIRHQNQLVAPQVLPELLGYAKNKKKIHPYLRPCIGARGQWLAKMNEEWHFALQVDLEDDTVFWYGQKEQRLLYIRQLRQASPQKALEKIKKTWKNESYTMRASLLKSLLENLSMEDEPFLEEALNDSRKTVRQEAVELLAQLEESRLVQRMTQRLQDLVSYDRKKERFEIYLPSACTKPMKRDGIVSRHRALKKQGPKAAQLAQIIAMVPLEWWERNCYKNPSELLHLIAQTEWFSIFVWGWAKAARRFGNEKWILAINRFRHDHLYKFNWQDIPLAFLNESLPYHLHNEIALDLISTDKDAFLRGDSPLADLLIQDEQLWNRTLSQIVISRIQQAIREDTIVFQWTAKAILQKAKFAIPPALYPKLKEGWPLDAPAFYAFRKEVDEFLHLMHFRYRIYEDK